MRLEIAADTNFGGADLYTFTVFPNDVSVPDGINSETHPGLDGGIFSQAPMHDIRPIILRFDDLIQHLHWAGADTIINEMRKRLFEKTGQTYFIRVHPSYDSATEGTSGTVSGSNFNVSPNPNWTDDEWLHYALVDVNNNSFRIIGNDADTLNWDTDEGTPADGDFTIIDRKANFLYKWNDKQGDAPIEVKVMVARVGQKPVPTSLQKTIYPFEVQFYPVF